VQPGLKLWVEKDGLLVFSDYRAELLDHIAKTGSISGGAERLARYRAFRAAAQSHVGRDFARAFAKGG
jgi:molybdenum-dependent DNA-binding transcriptional regulator ModE